VLLFDEFDVLDKPSEGQAGVAFFPYLRDLLSLDSWLQFIFVIGRRPEELSSLTISVFKGVKSYPVSLMSALETVNLVKLAERNNTLLWPDESCGHIYSLTGGHPFLTQQVCQQIWEQAYESDPAEPPAITITDIETAVPVALREATNALEWLWDGLKPAERVVASALAGAGPQAISQEELNQRLLDSGVRILIGELQDAPRVLQQWDLIAPVDGGYRFRVELLRHWIAERKPLARVQEEIDRIKPVADNLFQAGYNLYQSGQLDQAIPLLRQAIGFNPNHLRANQILAEILLAQGELTEARQILETLFQYQPSAARPRLVQTILRQAQDAKNDEERLALYERVLQLEPTRPEAAEERRNLWQKRGDEALAADDLEVASDAYRRANLPQMIIVVGLKQIRKFDEQGKYQAALELARQLYVDYPEVLDDLLDLDSLERKTRLDNLCYQVLNALQAGDWRAAKKLLLEVIHLKPNYRELLGCIWLVVKGIKVRIESSKDINPLSKPELPPPPPTPNILTDRLSPWNPLDHLHLLWWLFMNPQRFKIYQRHFSQDTVRRLAWVSSTLAWLPLCIFTLAIGVGVLPIHWLDDLLPRKELSILWLIIALGVAWLLTSLRGSWVKVVVVVALAVSVAYLMGGGVAIVVMYGIAFGIAVGVTFVQVDNLADNVAASVAVGMAFGIANSVGVIIAVVVWNISPVGAIIVMVIVMGVVMAVVGGGAANMLLNSVKSGRSSWVLRGSFGVLILTYAFTLWFSFFGGWQVFIKE
jgi:tetratricopeptide (TPR) repeat protein